MADAGIIAYCTGLLQVNSPFSFIRRGQNPRRGVADSRLEESSACMSACLPCLARLEPTYNWGFSCVLVGAVGAGHPGSWAAGPVGRGSWKLSRPPCSGISILVLPHRSVPDLPHTNTQPT